MSRKTSVRTSTIPGAGFGCFAEMDFEAYDVVTEYGGVIITEEDNKKNRSDFVFRCSDGTRYDACIVLNPLQEQGRFINDARGTENENNCTWYECKHVTPPMLYILASKSIKKGEELFIPYGEEYWENRQDDPLKKTESPLPNCT